MITEKQDRNLIPYSCYQSIVPDCNKGSFNIKFWTSLIPLSCHESVPPGAMLKVWIYIQNNQKRQHFQSEVLTTWNSVSHRWCFHFDEDIQGIVFSVHSLWSLFTPITLVGRYLGLNGKTGRRQNAFPS